VKLWAQEDAVCGIIGAVGKNDVATTLLDGLRRLEYRGYDSSGIATIHHGLINCCRSVGKIDKLAEQLARHPISGATGIGHTRWATHGRPNETNAHPIVTDQVAVVHNGIIENYRALRDELESAGECFRTQTDTEVIAVLLTRLLRTQVPLTEAVPAALKRLRGSFALAMVIFGHDNMVICARRGSPLVVGYGADETFIGSDALALGPLASQISFLEDGDWAVVTPEGACIRQKDGKVVQRKTVSTALAGGMVGKGSHEHFMQKEIYEQPVVVRDTILSLIDPLTRSVRLPGISLELENIQRVMIVACGTSYHAGLVAKYWFEGVAGVPADIEVASEFRYRRPVMPDNCLVLGISQSGETADTLAALRHARACGRRTIAVVNQRESVIERNVDGALWTLAGPEVSVASTKAFTTQLAVLACITLALARARGAVDAEQERNYVEDLLAVPGRIADVLRANEDLSTVARQLLGVQNAIFIGRGTCYPIALEGALKLKEISYIHAEGCAAGELKHGPLALLSPDVPVIALAPPGPLFDKLASNVQEVAARGAPVLFVSTHSGIDQGGVDADTSIALPACGEFSTPIVYSVPLQLLAYHAAVLRNTDVDRPRNLAKSVTVE
jgi:glutamine---fructose-6-phosphate transaminase (isomerizing)